MSTATWTVDKVFEDFVKRRSALVKALTTEADKFYNECKPDKPNQCLYGLPSGEWVVSLPCQEVPPEMPDPAVGINFARDGMRREDWLALVAVHSDVWLMSVVTYYSAAFSKVDLRMAYAATRTGLTWVQLTPGIQAVQQHPNTQGTGDGSEGRVQAEEGAEDQQQERTPFSCLVVYLFERVVIDTTSVGWGLVDVTAFQPPPGKVLKLHMITPDIRGREAHLYWPDDDQWCDSNIPRFKWLVGGRTNAHPSRRMPYSY
eukprot:scaffold2367_cov376-Prasinococcus_capsulatus_cf.AAC.3